ncbi:hypothetical protein [Acinetobacter sp. Marseille-Q1623]|uniref:hypothetical protein n=1 Tax=Acinetobacter sp. Marseille-Q1623 TaxID=2697501 RepID=UPI00157B8733|nr:hypothetical protein [Acinetobacter sp. Marseille-Q1623]
MKFKLFIASILLTFLSLSTLANADSWGTTEGPPKWGPWYLYQSKPIGYWIECTFKRKEIKDTSSSSGMSSIRTETQVINVARYPYGRCPDSLV